MRKVAILLVLAFISGFLSARSFAISFKIDQNAEYQQKAPSTF